MKCNEFFSKCRKIAFLYDANMPPGTYRLTQNGKTIQMARINDDKIFKPKSWPFFIGNFLAPICMVQRKATTNRENIKSMENSTC